MKLEWIEGRFGLWRLQGIEVLCLDASVIEREGQIPWDIAISFDDMANLQKSEASLPHVFEWFVDQIGDDAVVIGTGLADTLAKAQDLTTETALTWLHDNNVDGYKQLMESTRMKKESAR
jgi:hypothetical protein